ncbi:hypothetical protein TNIN_75821 [Trichonephila inaurata madagascariensis]|uniref:Uncharacterized protein n=1 Tax=Trichonephila inaurata madagascariensis TaxID=2747483 RepID=A0A8X6IR90_9ARAC|nr:hypothetical protein TNIN_75821 [Trichonephila inaurata madagascariensis]
MRALFPWRNLAGNLVCGKLKRLPVLHVQDSPSPIPSLGEKMIQMLPCGTTFERLASPGEIPLPTGLKDFKRNLERIPTYLLNLERISPAEPERMPYSTLLERPPSRG